MIYITNPFLMNLFGY